MSEGKSGPVGSSRGNKGQSNSHRAGEVASIELPWPCAPSKRRMVRLASVACSDLRDAPTRSQGPECGYAGTSRRRVVHGNPPGYPATVQDGDEMDGVLGSPHRGSAVKGAQGAIPTSLGWCWRKTGRDGGEGKAGRENGPAQLTRR